MAHQTQYTPFLLGIGIRTFSVDPIYLLRTQQAITATSLKDAEALAKDDALQEPDQRDRRPAAGTNDILTGMITILGHP